MNELMNVAIGCPVEDKGLLKEGKLINLSSGYFPYLLMLSN